MISLDEALARIVALASPLEEETVLLPEAIGRWSASPLRAKRTQPARALSAMDGYAISSQGLPGPWLVIGESAAGNRFTGKIKRGEAVRIFTGAALPDGADTVIIQEDVTRIADAISIAPDLSIRNGQHVRAAGMDFAEGDLLFEGGERLTAARIALAATAGHGALAVRKKPHVVILSTGDELVPAGAPIGDDQIADSNTIMLAAMLQDFRCVVSSPGVIPDSMDAICAAIEGNPSDILVTCGGASVGDHDLVRPALEKCGASLDFWKVAMRPGKPVMAGKRGNQIVLGLPGNPVSAFVTAHLFLRTLVASLAGSADPLPQRQVARLSEPLAANGDRADHIRAIYMSGTVFPTGLNDSSALLGLASANALIVRPPAAPPAKIGDEVDIYIIA